MRHLIAAVVLTLPTVDAFAQPVVKESPLRGHLAFLADDVLEAAGPTNSRKHCVRAPLA